MRTLPLVEEDAVHLHPFLSEPSRALALPQEVCAAGGGVYRRETDQLSQKRPSQISLRLQLVAPLFGSAVAVDDVSSLSVRYHGSCSSYRTDM